MGSREKIGGLRNKNRASAFLMPYKACTHLATLFAEFIVGICELNLDEIFDDYFAEKSIYFDQLEVYFQLFTQTQELSESIRILRARVAHQDSMLF